MHGTFDGEAFGEAVLDAFKERFAELRAENDALKARVKFEFRKRRSFQGE